MDIKSFVMAGNAIFTIKSIRTGGRFTYRIRLSEDGRVYFVSVLTGSDNENGYAYLGIIRDGQYHRGQKSRISTEATSAKAFEWFFRHLEAINDTEIKFWHEGRCGRCGRKLTVPESIASGFGPECINHIYEAAA